MLRLLVAPQLPAWSPVPISSKARLVEYVADRLCLYCEVSMFVQVTDCAVDIFIQPASV